MGTSLSTIVNICQLRCFDEIKGKCYDTADERFGFCGETKVLTPNMKLFRCEHDGKCPDK